MKLSEFFLTLSAGNLSNLALAQTDDVSGIDPLKHRSLVAYTNDALTRLYGRFLLREGTLMIEEVEGRTTYPLQSKYAMSNFSADAGHAFFIQDQWGQPFVDDLIKVLSVTDSFGRDLPLNDPDDISSVFTPQPDVLQVPHPWEGIVLGVGYQAKHPKLVYVDGALDLNQEISLPESLSAALSSYVAHKVYSNMNTQENTIKAAEHLKMFEMICIECVEYDLVGGQSSSSGARFVKRGWV
jgi:hypothetical protein